MGGGTRAEVEEGGCRLCDVGQAWPTWDVFVFLYSASALQGESTDRGGSREADRPGVRFLALHSPATSLGQTDPFQSGFLPV